MQIEARYRTLIVLAAFSAFLVGCASRPDIARADTASQSKQRTVSYDTSAEAFQEQQQKMQQDEQARLQAQVDGERMLHGQPPVGN